jgi:hypothetical protein
MLKPLLTEYLDPKIVKSTVLTEDSATGKHLYMKGIFIQGDVRNANQRIYPTHEIRKAVQSVQELIKENNGLIGESDHPADLKINLDRISHVITEMWMEGNDGHGKLRIIDTPSGNIIKAILEANVKLGVSSRGSGNVNESTGYVSDFEIVTVDIVAQPSAPNARPTPIYEGIMNLRHGHKIYEMAAEVNQDVRVQKYFQQEIINVIKGLKLR